MGLDGLPAVSFLRGHTAQNAEFRMLIVLNDEKLHVVLKRAREPNRSRSGQTLSMRNLDENIKNNHLH
jgi:hypothetical protein